MENQLERIMEDMKAPLWKRQAAKEYAGNTSYEDLLLFKRDCLELIAATETIMFEQYKAVNQ